jgi:hypothetical protein
MYGYLTSTFSVASLLLFFGNIYVLPYFGYSNLLLLAGLLSASNLLFLYFLNDRPVWPVVLISLRPLRSKPTIAAMRQDAGKNSHDNPAVSATALRRQSAGV